MPERVAFLKPPASTETWYVPTGSSVAEYKPSEFVTSDRTTCARVVEVMVTLALAMEAPEGSVTTPVMVPVTS